jgi:hypothetical protein
LVALAPASLLLAGSAIVFFRERHTASFLQLFGAGCLALVVLAHICEALRLFSCNGLGGAAEPGALFENLGSAVIGITLFPLGYLLHEVNPSRGRDWDRR